MPLQMTKNALQQLTIEGMNLPQKMVNKSERANSDALLKLSPLSPIPHKLIAFHLPLNFECADNFEGKWKRGRCSLLKIGSNLRECANMTAHILQTKRLSSIFKCF